MWTVYKLAIIFSLPLWSLGSLGAAQLDLEWVDAATGEASYTVQWSKEPGYEPLIGSADLDANTEAYSITGLEHNTLYYVRVYSSNAKGDSDNLDGSWTTVPAGPTSLSASNADGSKVSLSWSAPDGGADSYKVEYKKAVESTWTEFAGGVTETSDTVTGLDGENSYDFRVRGTSVGGDGAYSNTDSVTTGVALPPLLVETFERAESVSNATGTADNAGWYSSNSTNDFDFTSALAGDHSLTFENVAHYVQFDTGNANPELWVYFRFQGTVESTFSQSICTFMDATEGVVARISARSNYAEIYCHNGMVQETANIDNWSTDWTEERHIWLRYGKGSGANGKTDLYTSPTADRPATPGRTITTGDATSAAQIVRFLGGSHAVIDDVLVQSDEIGSNPSFGESGGDTKPGSKPESPRGLQRLDR